MKRKLWSMVSLLLATNLVACGTTTGTTETISDTEGNNAEVSTATAESEADTISVVATIFPEYDWAKEVIGDTENVELTMLLDNGVDLHSYQPTAADILKVATCDVFIYVGGESDDWVEDALEEATNPDMVVINLMEVLGDDAKEEEVVEGMEVEEDDAEEEDDTEEVEYDEHVWLSLRNAQVFVQAIADALQSVDASQADSYAANAQAYIEELAALDQAYTEMVESATYDTVLFGDRFPFRYLTDDYGLTYYAAFVGCSAETEASFETITFLAQKVDELSLNTILTIENSDGKIAETIKNNTASQDQEILALDSMQATTSEDVENGVTYLSIMQSNLEVLTEALN